MRVRSLMRLARDARRDGGAVAAEFALVLVLALPLMIGIVEVGRLLYAWTALANVGDAVVRAAITRAPETSFDAGFLTGAVADAVTSELPLWADGTVTAALTEMEDSAGFTLTYPHEVSIPFGLVETVSLSVTRTVE